MLKKTWIINWWHLFMNVKMYVCVCVCIQLLSCVKLFVTPWTGACQAPLSSAISWSLLRFVSTESLMLSNHFILCCPLLCLQSLLTSGSFPVSWHFASSGQSIRAAASVLAVNIQDWFPSGLTDLINSVQSKSFQSKELSRVFFRITIQKHHSLALNLLDGPALTSIHDYWKKNIALTRWTFVGKVMSCFLTCYLGLS